jgi:hypothetical protein
MPFKHGFKARANRIAVTIRKNLQLAPTDPLDPWQVCRHLDIGVLPLSEILADDGSLAGHYFLHEQPEVFSAFVVPGAMGRVIVHNDSHKLVRQRSNLTHELAHCFLGHPLVPPINADGQRNRDSSMEEEAAFLGGALLISNEAAHHIIKAGMIPSATIVYGVSREMLDYRLSVSGAKIAAFRRAGRISTQ